MTQKYCTIDEDELKELMAKVAGIQAWIRNDANIGEIQKRVNVLEYLLQKLERKLTQRIPDAANICRIVNHVYVDGICAECGSIEPPRR